MKSKDKLLSFVKYCLEHPEERFWQALRNWLNYPFIFAWRPRQYGIKDDGGHQAERLDELEKIGLEDTFYWE